MLVPTASELLPTVTLAFELLTMVCNDVDQRRQLVFGDRRIHTSKLQELAAPHSRVPDYRYPTIKQALTKFTVEVVGIDFWA